MNKPEPARIIHGVHVSAERLKIIQQLNEQLAPHKSLERIESYAKWIFGLGLTIGSLGLGLNLFTGPLQGNAAIVFSLSVFFFAVSLALSVWVLQPQWIEVNVNDARIIEKVNGLLNGKRWPLVLATLSLILSLFAAGATPALRALHKPAAALPPVYSIGTLVRDDSAFVTLKGYRFDSASLGAIRIGTQPMTQAFASAAADTLGQVTFQLNAKRPASANDIAVTGGMFHYRTHRFTDSTIVILWPTQRPPSTTTR